MGIADLIRLLKPAISNMHISSLSNQTAAIDMMTWLYKGVYSCAYDLSMNISTDQYLNFPIKMLALLAAYKIKPIAVFDGRSFKPKGESEESRRTSKEKNLEIAKSYLNAGDEENAKKYFRMALKITNVMLNTLIEILKRLNIQVVVAPYEADAQIAHLCINGDADFAITEDSDLILFGAQKICYKLDKDGQGMFLDFKKLQDSKDEDIDDPFCKLISKY